MFENLLLERGAALAVTINRPQVLNALNASTIDDLHRAAVELASDSSVRAVILTGS